VFQNQDIVSQHTVNNRRSPGLHPSPPSSPMHHPQPHLCPHPIRRPRTPSTARLPACQQNIRRQPPPRHHRKRSAEAALLLWPNHTTRHASVLALSLPSTLALNPSYHSTGLATATRSSLSPLSNAPPRSSSPPSTSLSTSTGPLCASDTEPTSALRPGGPDEVKKLFSPWKRYARRSTLVSDPNARIQSLYLSLLLLVHNQKPKNPQIHRQRPRHFLKWETRRGSSPRSDEDGGGCQVLVGFCKAD